MLRPFGAEKDRYFFIGSCSAKAVVKRKSKNSIPAFLIPQIFILKFKTSSTLILIRLFDCTSIQTRPSLFKTKNYVHLKGLSQEEKMPSSLELK